MIKTCIIEYNRVTVDKQVLFSAPESLTLEDFLLEAYTTLQVNYPRFHKMDLVCKLGIVASSSLLVDVGQTLANYNCAIIMSSNKGCSTSDLKYSTSLVSSEGTPFPALFTYTLPNIVLGELSIKHQIKGENFCFISKDFDKNMNYNIAKHFFEKTATECCLIGWIDVENEHSYKSKLSLLTRKNFNHYINQ